MKLFALFVTLLTSASTLFAMGGRPSDPNVPPPPAWVQIVPFLVMFAVFYLLLIRPQSKQRKERQLMIDSLKRGDKVVTQGGLIGTIVNITPETVELKINDETKAKFIRSAITDIFKEPSDVKTPVVVS